MAHAPTISSQLATPQEVEQLLPFELAGTEMEVDVPPEEEAKLLAEDADDKNKKPITKEVGLLSENTSCPDTSCSKPPATLPKLLAKPLKIKKKIRGRPSFRAPQAPIPLMQLRFDQPRRPPFRNLVVKKSKLFTTVDPFGNVVPVCYLCKQMYHKSYQCPLYKNQ